MSITQLNLSLNNFQNTMSNNPNNTYIVDFMADWCGPCKVLSPYLTELANNHASDTVKFHKVNIDNSEHGEELSQYFNVAGLATILIFKNNKILSSVVGMDKGKIKNSIKEAVASQ